MPAESFSALPLSDQVAAHILREQAARIGGRVLVTCAGAEITYREADDRANRVAAAFYALGIRKGDRVGILLHNCIEYLDLWFGLSRIGAIQLPLNTAYKSPQLLHALSRAPVVAIVTEDALLSDLSAVIDQMPAIRTLLVIGNTQPRVNCTYLFFKDFLSRASTAAPEQTIIGADVGAIMNTSGTTGPSKGVQLSHAQQYILGRNIAHDLALTEGDVYYNCFPLFHNTAQAMITLPVLIAGAKMVLVERFSATRFWPDVNANGCTTFYYIGETLRILLKSTTVDDSKGTPLRIGWGIGASAADFNEFQSRHGIALRTGYGSTEGNVPVFLPHENANLASVGRVIEGFELRIANEHSEALATNVAGEILVRSSEPSAIMHGYDGDADATIAAWKDLWFHTGDCGYLDGGGNLFFTGRVKDTIRVRGENVSAFEIEQVIAQVNGVLEVAAIAVPCDLGGDDIKIVVVRQAAAALAGEKLIAHAQSQLPKFAVPRYIEFVDALPKTETNKVRKNVLRETPFSSATWDRLAQQQQRQQ